MREGGVADLGGDKVGSRTVRAPPALHPAHTHTHTPSVPTLPLCVADTSTRLTRLTPAPQVRLHVMVLGTLEDMHTPNMGGPRFDYNGMHTDSIQISPGGMVSADVQMTSPGEAAAARWGVGVGPCVGGEVGDGLE